MKFRIYLTVTVFAIAASPPFGANGIEAAISSKYARDEWLKVTDAFWLVSDTGIAKDVSDKLGIGNDVEMSAVIVAFGGYYGRAPNHIWEWIALKLSQKVTADGNV